MAGPVIMWCKWKDLQVQHTVVAWVFGADPGELMRSHTTARRQARAEIACSRWDRDDPREDRRRGGVRRSCGWMKKVEVMQSERGSGLPRCRSKIQGTVGNGEVFSQRRGVRVKQ